MLTEQLCTFIQFTSVYAAICVCGVFVCVRVYINWWGTLLQYVVYVLWQNMKLAMCTAHSGLANDDQESMGFKYVVKARRDYLYVIEYL